ASKWDVIVASHRQRLLCRSAAGLFTARFLIGALFQLRGYFTDLPVVAASGDVDDPFVAQLFPTIFAFRQEHEIARATQRSIQPRDLILNALRGPVGREQVLQVFGLAGPWQ